MNMTVTDWIQAISTLVLVGVTAFYAWRTHVMSKATKEQAKASVKMAEEMREQRIIASRPVIIQRAMFETAASSSALEFSYFEIFNAVNSPAIEVEISAFDEEKTRRKSEKRSFFHSGESIKFYLDWKLTDFIGKTCYLVSEYQSIYSRGSQTWYQTRLPFKISQITGTDKIMVLPRDLEFLEVSKKDRIDAFNSGSKPK